MVTELGAVTYKLVAAELAPTFTAISTVAPFESNTEIWAVPAATPLNVTVAPLTLAVATRVSLLLTA